MEMQGEISTERLSQPETLPQALLITVPAFMFLDQRHPKNYLQMHKELWGNSLASSCRTNVGTMLLFNHFGVEKKTDSPKRRLLAYQNVGSSYNNVKKIVTL
jgi:hypothetical protein